MAPLELTLLSCAILGFRHGFDYDHIAAISDIASVQKRVSSAMRLGLAYALGHAFMLSLLGGAVIWFQLALPQGMNAWAERLVGVTLIVLAIYVMGTLVWGDPNATPPSRAALMVRAYCGIRRRLTGRAVNDGPGGERDFNYTAPVAFGVGLIHGLGAETPSQLALFLLAANLGGVGKGFAGMSMFLVGLLVMNTIMTASASGCFHLGAFKPRLMRVMMGLTAGYSFVVGWIFLLGSSGMLPAIAG